MIHGANLTPDEFRQLHNALCELRGVHQRINGILNPELLLSMGQSIKDMEDALASSYQRDSDLIDKNSEHYETVAKLGGFRSIWSLYEVPFMYDPHPYQGVKILEYTRGYLNPSKIKVPVSGPLWVDLWEAADAAILQSGDNHHIFIEGFCQDLEVVTLTTGS